MINTRIILLSAFLLLSQSGMLLHELDADHYAAGHQQCEICLSVNGLDKALSQASLAVAPILWGNADRLQKPVPNLFPRAASSYQSRAPPLA